MRRKYRDFVGGGRTDFVRCWCLLCPQRDMEIADWRCPHNRVHDDIYKDMYLRMWYEINGKGQPEEEWDDRNRMYSVYYEIDVSVNHMRNNRGVGEASAGKAIPLLPNTATELFFANCDILELGHTTTCAC